MRNKMFFAGILSMALVFGMIVGGCSDGGDSKKDDDKTFTVSFDAGEGSGTAPEKMKVKDGKSISLPGKGNLTAPAGKEFDGWKGGGSTYAAGDSYIVKSDIVFVAQWKSTAPAAPTGVKVRIGHFAISYKDEVITKITIYEYDSSKMNNQGTVHQTVTGLALEYGKYWEDGLVTKNGKYVVEAVVGANAYSGRGEIEVYDLSSSAIVLQYNGYNLVKQ